MDALPPEEQLAKHWELAGNLPENEYDDEYVIAEYAMGDDL